MRPAATTQVVDGVVAYRDGCVTRRGRCGAGAIVDLNPVCSSRYARYIGNGIPFDQDIQAWIRRRAVADQDPLRGRYTHNVADLVSHDLYAIGAVLEIDGRGIGGQAYAADRLDDVVGDDRIITGRLDEDREVLARIGQRKAVDGDGRRLDRDQTLNG